jgi:hypothetical protein
MPLFETEDLAFRAPSGGTADDTRNAFERTDARIKRLLGGVSTAMGVVETSLEGLQGSINVVAGDLTSSIAAVNASIGVVDAAVGAVDTDLQTWKSGFNGRFDTRFDTRFGTSIGTMFTTASTPGFAQVNALTTTASNFIMVGIGTKEPRWQSKADFVKYTLGLETPFAYANHGYNFSNQASVWGGNGLANGNDLNALAGHFDSYVNGINNSLFNLIAALKSAKVFV